MNCTQSIKRSHKNKDKVRKWRRKIYIDARKRLPCSDAKAVDTTSDGGFTGNDAIEKESYSPCLGSRNGLYRDKFQAMLKFSYFPYLQDYKF